MPHGLLFAFPVFNEHVAALLGNLLKKFLHLSQFLHRYCTRLAVQDQFVHVAHATRYRIRDFCLNSAL